MLSQRSGGRKCNRLAGIPRSQPLPDDSEINLQRWMEFCLDCPHPGAADFRPPPPEKAEVAYLRTMRDGQRPDPECIEQRTQLVDPMRPLSGDTPKVKRHVPLTLSRSISGGE